MFKERVITAVILASILFISMLGVCEISQAEILVDYQKEGVLLNWSEPSRRITGEKLLPSEIIGYNIYRRPDADGDYQQINQHVVKGTQFIDRTIHRGNCYYYTLTTVDDRGLEGPHSSIISAIPPLSPPLNVQAFGQKRSIALKWDRSNNPNIRGYAVYRSEVSRYGYRNIASVLETHSEYLDREVMVGKNYYYEVTTVDISWQESERSPEVAATPVLITQEELATLERISGFRASVKNGVVLLQWEPVSLDGLAGYNVYRRSGKTRELNAYKKMNKDLLRETTFYDEEVEAQKTYYYSIAAVDKNENEAQFPKEIFVTVGNLYINSLSHDSGVRPLKGGESLAITLVGTPGQEAFVLLDALNAEISLAETDHEGVYYGEYTIPGDIHQADVSLIGIMQNEKGEAIDYRGKESISIDNIPPAGVRFADSEVKPETVCLAWEFEGPVDDIASVEIFRSAECPDGPPAGELISGRIEPGETFFCDSSISPRQDYFYSLAVYDRAGNVAFSEGCYFVSTLADAVPPTIQSVKELSPPGTKRPGDVIIIQLIGEARAEGIFCLGEKIRQVFQEVQPGQYIGEYVVQVGDDLESESVLVELIDSSGNRTLRREDIHITINTRDNSPDPPHVSLVEHNAFQLAGFAPLVADDTLRFLVHGDTGCTAYVDLGAAVTRSGDQTDLELHWDRNLVLSKFGHDINSYHIYCQDTAYTNVRDLTPIHDLSSTVTHYHMEDYQRGYVGVTARRRTDEEHLILTPRLKIPLTEVEPGLYEGTYRIQPGDYLWDEPVIAYLVNRQGDVSLPVSADNPITIDTGVDITVNPQEKCLRADSRSRNNVYLEVKDARGMGVANRELILELFTTIDEYSGIIGVGSFDEDKFGYLDDFTRLVTDFSGSVTVPYISGFAAKTVIFRARDIISDCVGLGYITSYVEGEFSFELMSCSSKRLKSSFDEFSLYLWIDEKDWRGFLTADGWSKIPVHAKVTDREGNPAPGHEIWFDFKSGYKNGTITRSQKETGPDGTISAIYTAGKKISPSVIIVAFDKTADGLMSENELYIPLKSDAPANITITQNDGSEIPACADGISTLDLTIRVEDINENPNRHIPLQVDIIEGNGNLEFDFGKKTDYNGKCTMTYRAGYTQGKVTIRARAVSRIPSPEVLDEIRVTEDVHY